MRYEKAVLLFVLVVSFIAVVPSLALEEDVTVSANGLQVTEDEVLDSLSQKINLKVNGFQIILNQELNESELKSHKFEKLGSSALQIIKAERNEVVFFSENCELTYLKEDSGDVIFPILDVKAGAAMMYGTSSYVFYKQNNLSKFVFQIIYNRSAAQKHIAEFEQKLVEYIGKPYSTNGAFTIWEMGNQRLALEYPKKEHGYIFLMMID